MVKLIIKQNNQGLLILNLLSFHNRIRTSHVVRKFSLVIKNKTQLYLIKVVNQMILKMYLIHKIYLLSKLKSSHKHISKSQPIYNLWITAMYRCFNNYIRKGRLTSKRICSCVGSTIKILINYTMNYLDNQRQNLLKMSKMKLKSELI